MQRLITPSKVTAWLECPHYLTLDGLVASGELKRPHSVAGNYADLLRAKGDAHEKACLAELRATKRIKPIPSRLDGEPFDSFVQRVGNPFLEDDWDILYQMPFIYDGMRGTADFVERKVNQDTGALTFEPIDSKLARKDAKPGHVLQLCFYADGIEQLSGIAPQNMQIWLGSGERESLRLGEFQPYWRRIRERLAIAMAPSPPAQTKPERCAHCQFCEFQPICEDRWRNQRSLTLVARIRSAEKSELETAGVKTIDDLARSAAPVATLSGDRYSWLHRQAALQSRAEIANRMPFELLDTFSSAGEPEDDDYKHRLPRPDDGDVFIDFEGHPFWTVGQGLFFLFGLLERQPSGRWNFIAKWAHTPGEERAAAADLIAYLTQRRQQFPGMHIYHYNSTERTNLISLADGHPVAESQIADLANTGAFIDLYRTVLNSIQIGAESYSLKCVEKLTDFERSHAIESGAGAVLSYEDFLKTGNQDDLARIARYNEDDVRATLAVRDWLVSRRPPGTAWRSDYLDAAPEREVTELREREVRLHAFGTGTDEHFLGDLIGYWWRERQADLGPKRARLERPAPELLEDPGVLAGLRFVGTIQRVHKKTGSPILPAMRFSFPEQSISAFSTHDGATLFVDAGGNTQYPNICDIDLDARVVDFVWTEKLKESGHIPTAVVHDDWINDSVKAKALQAFADDVLEGRPLNPATVALLKRELPHFTGAGPHDGNFTADLPALKELVLNLDRSYIAVQGPPGTGKTFTAAHLIRFLVLAKRRVGITALSHSAIDNLLREVFKVFDQEGGIEELHCGRQKRGAENVPNDVKLLDNKKLADSDLNLVAGSTWTFSAPVLRDSPVDVLFIDEAGQLGLADALATSTAARNIVVLGDPLQLAQVTKASHPGESGCSVLTYVLNGDETIKPDRGVFLSITRRMHADVCKFISEQIYEGRLQSHPDCNRQTTAAGTGLRWIRATHRDNTSSSIEEGLLILDAIRGLLGTAWTDSAGRTQPLTKGDFVVVTPYNDQRLLLDDLLGSKDDTKGIYVATVDKFQGQEKPIVFFSMAASTGEDAPRGKQFLFSRNRLNVAVSRAQCLAYLVCTEDLLYTRASSVEDMRLMSTLNSFIEYADRGGGQTQSSSFT